ncbi:MAG: hypothetical protein FJ086_17305 [Deltaproteobacteria bacterium]|nr:hypothetical protein [Deltaproteobacteria bacterium]
MYAKWKERLSDVVQRYGAVALVTHYGLGALFFFGLVAAWKFGYGEPLARQFGLGATAEASAAWGGAYVVYKATMLPRMMVTAVLTPGIARVVGRSPKPPAAP